LKEWIAFGKTKNFPNNLPKSPDVFYKNEFEGYGVFLGTGVLGNKNRTFLTYDEAKKIVHKLKLKSSGFWIDYINSEKYLIDIPRSPEQVYKKKGTWKGWGDFLGTGRKPRSKKG